MRQPIDNPTKKRKGFAAMDPQRVREIASQGGKTAHRNGNGHQFSSEEASDAALKGWENRRKRNGQEPKDPI